MERTASVPWNARSRVETSISRTFFNDSSTIRELHHGYSKFDHVPGHRRRGGLARRLDHEGAGFGLLGNIVVGIIGALVGGFLFGVLGLAAGGLIGSLIIAVIGVVVLLFLIGLIKKA